jgi:catechol 2,3-dioxygenase-like lactoylglutathione lyase family enzyme
MKYNSMIPELTVSDIKQTKDFYINKLGFTLEYEREKDKFIFLSYNSSQFMFEQIHQTGWNAGDLKYPFGRGINFSICAADINALYKKVLHCDIKIYRELQEAVYRNDTEEVREVQFLIQDPDGYLLRFTD